MADNTDFEDFLSELAHELTKSARKEKFKNAAEFERAIRTSINARGGYKGQLVDENPHAQAFPDIAIKPVGIEVKFTENDTWRSVANSIFESTRVPGIDSIYVMFGKMGGAAEVRWDRYEKCVIHVRTSHVPRFELEIGTDEPIFDKFGVSYQDFQKLDLHEKMEHIRKYAKARLKPGDRLWWIDEEKQDAHTLPIEVRMYMNLPQETKRRLRAEGALLCPKIVSSSRTRNKYNDVVMYFLTYHGVLCPQARDLFSAGSVAMRADQKRGGNYILRALKDIEHEMVMAAHTLEPALFVEYWGADVPKENRIHEWLKRADNEATGWTPSKELFINIRA